MFKIINISTYGTPIRTGASFIQPARPSDKHLSDVLNAGLVILDVVVHFVVNVTLLEVVSQAHNT